jgi:hypothetical protein
MMKVKIMLGNQIVSCSKLGDKEENRKLENEKRSRSMSFLLGDQCRF